MPARYSWRIRTHSGEPALLRFPVGLHAQRRYLDRIEPMRFDRYDPPGAPHFRWVNDDEDDYVIDSLRELYGQHRITQLKLDILPSWVEKHLLNDRHKWHDVGRHHTVVVDHDEPKIMTVIPIVIPGVLAKEHTYHPIPELDGKDFVRIRNRLQATGFWPQQSKPRLLTGYIARIRTIDCIASNGWQGCTTRDRRFLEYARAVERLQHHQLRCFFTLAMRLGFTT